MMVPAWVSALSISADCRSARAVSASSQARRTQSRKSSATWSFRERAVCSRPADHLGEARLDVHVDVLERARELEPAGLDLVPDSPEALHDGLRVSPGDDILRRQHLGMRDRSPDVLGVEPAVEVDRGVDLLHDGGHAAGEAAAPEQVGGAVLGGAPGGFGGLAGHVSSR
jgi:hypothetical protein